MESLDFHVLREISEYLSYLDYLAFIGTCRRFYELNDIRRKIGYLEELHKDGGEFKRDELSTFVAYKGQLDVIKYLHSNNALFSTKTMDNAASNGHLNVIKWLHKNRTEGCTTHAMDLAALYGHLDVVKWLHENRTEG